MDEGKLKSLDELTKLLLEELPINDLCEKLETKDDWGEDEEDELDEVVELCYPEEGEGIEDCNTRGEEFEECNEEKCDLSQEEAQNVVAVEASHDREEVAAKMEIFRSPICDEDLLLL